MRLRWWRQLCVVWCHVLVCERAATVPWPAGILANIGRLVWLGTADEARPGTPVLQSAIRRRMRQPGGAPASMRHTVDALLLLPVERPADMSSSLWGQLVRRSLAAA